MGAWLTGWVFRILLMMSLSVRAIYYGIVVRGENMNKVTAEYEAASHTHQSRIKAHLNLFHKFILLLRIYLIVKGEAL